jgi:1-acyl-sn-glycerol-3-phosphate acyltransferase
MRGFLRIIVGIKFVNNDKLAVNKQYIIVSNHNSHLDTVAIMSSISVKRIARFHPVAAGDYFGQSPMRAFVTRFFVNAILIPRSRANGEQNPIKMMSDALAKGDSLILFPEGSRGEPEKMQHFKKGIGILLQMYPHIEYVPVFMKGLGKVLPKGERLLVPFTSYVVFGEPTCCIAKNVEEIVQEIEDSIIKLGETSFVKLEKGV